MIDTDKYEGCIADMKGYDLAILAEKLLAEVKRLHNHIRRMRHWAEPKMHEVHHDAWRKLHEEIYRRR